MVSEVCCVLGGGWGGVHTGFFVIETDLTKGCRETITCNLGRKDIKNLETVLPKKVRGFCFQS